MLSPLNLNSAFDDIFFKVEGLLHEKEQKFDFIKISDILKIGYTEILMILLIYKKMKLFSNSVYIFKDD